MGLQSKAPRVAAAGGVIPRFLERPGRGSDPPPFPQKGRGSTVREGVTECGALDFRHIATGRNLNRGCYEPLMPVIIYDLSE